VDIKREGKKLKINFAEIQEVKPNILGQIKSRDFRLIDQSDMVIACIPALENVPQISTGVERELAHAQQSTKDTYVIWQSSASPSVFQQATRIFTSIEEFLSFSDTNLLKK
jgi:nucleoside 2-deoxyribosyltransferase